MYTAKLGRTWPRQEPGGRGWPREEKIACLSIGKLQLPRLHVHLVPPQVQDLALAEACQQPNRRPRMNRYPLAPPGLVQHPSEALKLRVGEEPFAPALAVLCRQPARIAGLRDLSPPAPRPRCRYATACPPPGSPSPGVARRRWWSSVTWACSTASDGNLETAPHELRCAKPPGATPRTRALQTATPSTRLPRPTASMTVRPNLGRRHSTKSPPVSTASSRASVPWRTARAPHRTATTRKSPPARPGCGERAMRGEGRAEGGEQPPPYAQVCPACASARVMRHPELHEPAIAHLDCGGFRGRSRRIEYLAARPAGDRGAATRALRRAAALSNRG